MIGDREILGLGPRAGPGAGTSAGEDLAAIKRAFRKKVKELHPDIAVDLDPLQAHARFVAVCAAYRRLLAAAIEASPSAEARSSAEAGPFAEARPFAESRAGKGIVAHADPAYAFYKTGIRHFSAIHPSQWNFDTQKMLNTRIAGQDEDQEALKKRVIDLVKLFPKAYYYFGIVVHEYPDSAWAADAFEKMGKIEERIGMYRRIIESFSSWNVDAKDEIKRYHERFDKHAETRREVGRDMPKDWDH